MSTHNIGFYEDLTKIIFELSSNIIRYAPYYFCWRSLSIIIKHPPYLLSQYLTQSWSNLTFAVNEKRNSVYLRNLSEKVDSEQLKSLFSNADEILGPMKLGGGEARG